MMLKTKKLLSIVTAIVLLTGVIWIPCNCSAAETRNDIPEIFHDQGYLFISDIEPTSNENVTLRLRCAKSRVSSAEIQYSADDSTKWNKVSMSKECDDKTGYYEYFKGVVPAQKNPYNYRFYVKGDFGEAYCGINGEQADAIDKTHSFRIIPDFSTPDWAKGAYWYFINPDGFYNGDTLNDLVSTGGSKSALWGNSLSSLSEHYGGDLKGVTEKVKYIKELGVTSIYMNPIWDSRQCLAYGPSSFYKISPYLGNDKDLTDLIDTYHSNGIKVVLDAVLSYASTDNVWFNRYNFNPLDAASQSLNNKYAEMFTFTSFPDGYNTKWGGAQFNYSSQLLRNLIYKDSDSFIKRYLNAPYYADGWRFDATTSFDTGEQSAASFFSEIKESIKSQNSNAIMISEDFVPDYLKSGCFDCSYNARSQMRNWFDFDLTQSQLVEAFENFSAYPRSEMLCNLTLFDLHDESRISSDSKADFAKLKALALLQMTYVGAPTVYYGDEIGLENRIQDGKGAQKYNCFNWNESDWNIPLYNVYKSLGEARNTFSALKDGVVKFGGYDDTKKTLYFGRFNENESIITVTNQFDGTSGVLNVSQFNVKDGDVLTDWFSGKKYTVVNGKVNVSIPAGGTVLSTSTLVSNSYYADADDESEKIFDDKGFTVDGKSVKAYKSVKSNYTFKVEIAASTLTDGEMIAVADIKSDDDLVFAGRMNNGGEQVLAFGKRINGQNVIFGSVKDLNPDLSCTVQLQKNGIYYSAVYKYGDTEFKLLGDGLSSNYSFSKVGIISDSKVKSRINYWSFGNAIEDNHSINTPCYPEKIDYSFSDRESSHTRQEMSVLGNQSDWEYVNGGIARVSGDGISQLFISRKYNDFKVNVVLSPQSDNSVCGVTMLRSSVDNSLGGYVLGVSKSGTLFVKQGNTVLFEKGVSIDENGLQIVAEKIGSKLYVFSGNAHNFECALNVNDISGYITFFADGLCGIFNESVNSLSDCWNDVNGDYLFALSSSSIVSKADGQSLCEFNRFGLTDMAISATVSLSSVDSLTEAYQGFFIDGESGQFVENSDAILVLLNADGSVSLNSKGEKLRSSVSKYGITNVKLTVLKKDNILNVYVNNALLPELTYNTDFNGGTFGIVSNSSNGYFKSLYVTDISGVQTEPEYTSECDESAYSLSQKKITGSEVFEAPKDSITSNEYCASFKASTKSTYLEARYRSGANGNLAIRFGSNGYLSIYKDGALKTRYTFETMGISADFSISNSNKYTFAFKENGIQIYINSVPIAFLNGEMIYTAGYANKIFALYMYIQSGKEAEISDLSVWNVGDGVFTEFFGENGENLGKVVCKSGDDISNLAPKYLANPGETFEGWSKNLTNIQISSKVYALTKDSDEPSFDKEKHSGYVTGVYDGKGIFSKSQLPVMLSGTDVSRIYETGIGNSVDYYVTATFSDVTADCFHIVFKGENGNYAALRLYKDQMVAVNKAGTASLSDWVRYSAVSQSNIDLSSKNRVTVHIANGKIAVWINGAFYGNLNFNSNYSSFTNANACAGAYMYSGKSATLIDIESFTDKNNGLRPVFNKNTHIKISNCTDISLGETSAMKTEYISNLPQREKIYVSFAFKTDASFINIPFASDGSQTLMFRLYPSQCIICSSTNKVYTPWVQLSSDSLSYIKSIWGQLIHIDMIICKSNITVFINGKQITSLVYETQPSGFETNILGFASYGGTFTDVSDIKIFSDKNSLLGDINSDGAVNALDIACIKDYLLNRDIDISLQSLDINGDGSIDLLDLIRLKKVLCSVN